MTTTLILGDIHGHWRSANALVRYIQRGRITYDEIIQVGDMGFWPGFIEPWSWDPGCRARWVDGNHEHFTRLHARDQNFGLSPEEFRTHTWPVQWSRFLERWEYQPRGTIEDGILFIGGAYSIDRHRRTLGVDWFREEMISREDEETVWDAIDNYGAANIHTVITHDCPKRFKVLDAVKARNGSIAKDIDCPNRRFLDAVFDVVQPERWFFGHYHIRWHDYVDGCYARCISLVEDRDFYVWEH